MVDFILDATLEAFEFLTKLALPRSALEDQLDRGNAFHIEQQQSEQKSPLVGGSHDCLYKIVLLLKVPFKRHVIFRPIS